MWFLKWSLKFLLLIRTHIYYFLLYIVSRASSFKIASVIGGWSLLMVGLYSCPPVFGFIPFFRMFYVCLIVHVVSSEILSVVSIGLYLFHHLSVGIWQKALAQSTISFLLHVFLFLLVLSHFLVPPSRFVSCS